MTESTLYAESIAGRAGEEDRSKPIAAYGLLADCNSAALVDSAGSIDWLCLPRYDIGLIKAAWEIDKAKGASG